MMPAVSPQLDPKRLFGRLAWLRFRLRMNAAVQGIAAVAAILLGGIAVAGLLDWRFQLPPLVRALILVSQLAAAGWAFIRWLLLPLLTPADNLHLALRLENQNPQLNDILASAVSFLQDPSDQEEVSSPLLRKVTVRRAMRMADECDYGTLLNRRGVFYSLLGLAAALAVALPPVLKAPHAIPTALRRLTMPFGSSMWPAQTKLRIVSPDRFPYRLALGEAFEVHGELSGYVPERATFTVWFEGMPPSDSIWVVGARDSGDRGTVVARVEASRISRNFHFRLKANDADTGWLEVQVLPPPELVPLDGRPSPQIRLEYPRYTDLAPRQMPDGGSSFEAVAGTSAHLRAATNRPIALSYLVYRPEIPSLSIAAALAPLPSVHALEATSAAAGGQSVWAAVPVRLGREGRLLDVTFTPRVSGVYELRFEDETGFGSSRLIDIRVLPDPAPTVTLDRPSASHDSLTVTPNASLPLKSAIADAMFAVRSAWLEYRTNKSEMGRRFYFDHQQYGQLLPRMFSTAVPPLRLRWQNLLIDNRLEVASFRHADQSPLREGDLLVIQMAADDFDDVTFDKAPGRSHEVELRIVSPAALDAMLNKDQAALRQSLLQLQKWQKEAREKVQQAAEKLTPEGKIRPESLEQLLQAEQQQQQIRSKVGDEKEGLRAEANRIRQAQRDNRLPPSASRDRAETVAGELDRLGREELEPIEPLLNSARESAGSEPNKPAEPQKTNPLAEALKHQREAEKTIDSLLQRLEPWSGANELRGETRALLTEQEKVNDQTGKLEQEIASGQSRPTLSQEQQEQLDRAGARQEALAGQAKDLLDKVGRVTKEKQEQEQARLAEAKQLDATAAERERLAEQEENEQRKGVLQREAQQMRTAAQEKRETAADLHKEAHALKEAEKAAAESKQQDDPSAAPEKMDANAKQAAQNIRDNKLGEARKRQEQTAKTMSKMLDALEERRRDDLDRLAKKMRDAEQKLDALMDKQERLQKKVREAQQIADPVQRDQELERLAREQEKLRDEAKDLAQELSRLKAGSASQTLSRAGQEMANANERLQRGEKADDVQEDALEKLDRAQDELEKAREQVEEELMREKIAKVADLVKGIRDRQEAAVRETKRIHDAARRAKEWRRELQASIGGLRETEEGLARELDSLSEKHFRLMKIIAKMMEQASAAMRQASARLDAELDDQKDRPEFDAAADDKFKAEVLKWQEMALRRLDQFLDAIKEDKKNQAQGDSPSAEGKQPQGGRDDVPPLAQLKALRALQAEINQQTERFAQDHADPAKLTGADKAELELLRKMQRDIADLIQEFSPADAGSEEKP